MLEAVYLFIPRWLFGVFNLLSFYLLSSFCLWNFRAKSKSLRPRRRWRTTLRTLSGSNILSLTAFPLNYPNIGLTVTSHWMSCFAISFLTAWSIDCIHWMTLLDIPRLIRSKFLETPAGRKSWRSGKNGPGKSGIRTRVLLRQSLATLFCDTVFPVLVNLEEVEWPNQKVHLLQLWEQRQIDIDQTQYTDPPA